MKRVYSRAYASVRLMGDLLDPFDVTAALKLPADVMHRKGQPRLQRSRGGVVREFSPYSAGLWLMSSEKWVNSPRLAVHIEWLLQELEPKKHVLAALLQSGIEGDIFCYSVGSTKTAPSLPRKIRERAKGMGLRIEIDHYCESAE